MKEREKLLYAIAKLLDAIHDHAFDIGAMPDILSNPYEDAKKIIEAELANNAHEPLQSQQNPAS